MADNLFDNVPRQLNEEQVLTLLTEKKCRIERIVSTGQSSPTNFWYDQEETEWVVVLQGEARIEFEGDRNEIALAAGDFITIKPHERHRVAWTSDEGPTIWLAVFFTA